MYELAISVAGHQPISITSPNSKKQNNNLRKLINAINSKPEITLEALKAFYAHITKYKLEHFYTDILSKVHSLDPLNKAGIRLKADTSSLSSLL